MCRLLVLPTKEESFIYLVSMLVRLKIFIYGIKRWYRNLEKDYFDNKLQEVERPQMQRVWGFDPAIEDLSCLYAVPAEETKREDENEIIYFLDAPEQKWDYEVNGEKVKIESKKDSFQRTKGKQSK